MSVQAASPHAAQAASQSFANQLRERGQQLDSSSSQAANVPDSKPELREAFDSFVGQTFYGMLMKSMRKSLSETPYFHGGRGEEVFQQQLDQVMVEKMSEASAESFTGPMFELFSMHRS